MHTIFKNYEELLNNINFSEVKVVVLCGLPGSGKSTLGEQLADSHGYQYISSDTARVEVLKLTVGKLGTNSEYVSHTPKVYGYIRDEMTKTINSGGKVVIDATHLNDQRILTLEKCKELKLNNNEVLIIYVDAGSREEVLKRITISRSGDNLDGRSSEEAWASAYDFFDAKIKAGEITIPENSEKGYKVVWVKNY